MTHYLYLFEMLGYSNEGRPKIGITRNLERRKRQLWYSYGGLVPHLVALFEFDSVKEARKAELHIIRRFTPLSAEARELFKESCGDVLAYIKQSPFPCREVKIA